MALLSGYQKLAQWQRRNPSAGPGRRLLAVGLIALALLAGAAHVFGAGGGASAAECTVAPAAPGPRLAAPGSTRSSSDDPLGIVTTVRVGTWPSGIAYDSGRRELFVANNLAANVSVISDATGAVVATIPLSPAPVGVAYGSGRGEVYVARGDTNMSVISDATNAVVATVDLGPGTYPLALAYDAARSEVYAANPLSDTVTVISAATRAVVDTVSLPAGARPFALVYDAGAGLIFVAEQGANGVAIIDDTTHVVLGTVPLGAGASPSALAYDPAHGEVYVANGGADTVMAINDTTGAIVSTVTVGSGPSSLAYGAGTVLVASAGPSTASVIATGNHTVVGTVGLFLGGAPNAMAYDGGNGGWYIADAALNAVVIVAPGYFVTFTETGLSPGTSWQVWLNGTSAYGSSNVLSASVLADLRTFAPNGTYTFTVMPVAGYVATPTSGTVTVAGAGVGQAIAFAYQYSITFAEAGLPAGTTWSVTFAGTTKSTNGTSLAFIAGNGSHAFTVGDVSGYGATPASGSVTVNGAAVAQAIAFAPAPAGGIGTLAILLITVVVVVAVVGGVAVVLRRKRRAAPPGPGAPPSTEGTPPPTAPPP